MKTMEQFYRLKPPKNDIPPCREITKLQIDQSGDYEDAMEQEMLGNETNLSWFEIKVSFQLDTFKEIKQKRSYSEQSLIGNIGGYLGLLIGFTLLDLLSWMSVQFEKIKNILSQVLDGVQGRIFTIRNNKTNA